MNDNRPLCKCGSRRPGEGHRSDCHYYSGAYATEVPPIANAAPSSQVDHPSYYGGESNPYEAIKVIENWLTPEQFYGFLVGTSLKYYARAGKKAGESAAKDLAKADWYTQRAAKHKEMNP